MQKISLSAEAMQLPMWEAESKPIVFFDERGPRYPFRPPYYSFQTAELSHHRFSYWDFEQKRLFFSPYPLWLSFWKDDKTEQGELKYSVNGLPDREKDIWEARRKKWEQAASQLVPQKEVKPRKPRKPYKWSKKALKRNRLRKLRQRVEKKHGFNPDHPDLFDAHILLAIEAEINEKIAETPRYFEGENVKWH